MLDQIVQLAVQDAWFTINGLFVIGIIAGIIIMIEELL